MVWSYPKFAVFRDAQHVFSDLALYSDVAGHADQRATSSASRPNTSARPICACSDSRRRAAAISIGRSTRTPAPRPDDHLVRALAAALQRRSVDHRTHDRHRPRRVDDHRRRSARLPRTVRPRGSSLPLTTQPAEEFAATAVALALRSSRVAHRASAKRKRRAAVAMLGSRVSDAIPDPWSKLQVGRQGVAAQRLRGSRPRSGDRCSCCSAPWVSCCSSPASTSRICCSDARARGSARSPCESPSAPGVAAHPTCCSPRACCSRSSVRWRASRSRGSGVRALGTIDPRHDAARCRAGTCRRRRRVLGHLARLARARVRARRLRCVVGVLFGLAPALGAARDSFDGCAQG